MRRREFIALLSGAVMACVLPARAQSAAKLWRIGFLETTTLEKNRANLLAFTDALREFGYVEGSNLIIEYRSANGLVERFEELAAELVRLNTDVIVARGTPAIMAAKKASGTIPIVTTASAQPFSFVASLARPGGNVTGLSSLSSDLYAKRIELIKEAVPAMKRIGVMSNPTNPNTPGILTEIEKAVLSFGIEPHKLDLRSPDDIPFAFETANRHRTDAIVISMDTVTQANAKLITQLAAEHRLPAIYGGREFIEAGGLMSYGVNFPDLYRRAAAFVDKIIRGASPADLPIEQPTKFALLVNLKAAKALGLEITPTLLARADEVIE
jgi:putative tryptophan/tyrosine transport system substrate-binding protein